MSPRLLGNRPRWRGWAGASARTAGSREGARREAWRAARCSTSRMVCFGLPAPASALSLLARRLATSSVCPGALTRVRALSGSAHRFGQRNRGIGEHEQLLERQRVGERGPSAEVEPAWPYISMQCALLRLSGWPGRHGDSAIERDLEQRPIASSCARPAAAPLIVVDAARGKLRLVRWIGITVPRRRGGVWGHNRRLALFGLPGVLRRIRCPVVDLAGIVLVVVRPGGHRDGRRHRGQLRLDAARRHRA
jgi:hypothetical protein